MAEAVGLSIGASRFTGVLLGRAAVTRQSVLTLYDHRPPELGVPSENPNLNERGLVITDFVERVGDPVGLVAPDGSVHRGEALVSDALRAMQRTVAAGRPQAEPPTVTYPAHWRRATVDALRSALTAGDQQFTMISDAAAAMTALQSDPGVPTRGVIALCDFGGTGTSITLFDAADGYRPIGPTVRHPDFSGDLIDQALLKHVIADLSSAGAVDVSGTSALGSLHRLRAQCRIAKERLSGSTVTSLPVDVPGFRSEVRLTRTEVDDEIRQPLAEFVGVFQHTLDRAGRNPADLVAVASVGGGAPIPVITTTLSQHFRVPVITTPHAHMTAATGASLRAARGPADDKPTAMAPAAVVPPIADAGPQSSTFRALAWSEAHDLPPIAPAAEPHAYSPDARTGLSSVRPQLQFDGPEEVAGGPAPDGPFPWYRRPAVLAGAALAAVLVLATAAMLALRNNPTPASSTTPLAPSTTQAGIPSVLATQPPAGDSAPGQQQAPQTRTVVVSPPQATQVVQAPAPAVDGPPPAAAAPAPAAPPATQDPPPPVQTTADAPPPPPSTGTPTPVTDIPTPTQRARLIPTIPPIPTIPGLPPFVPQPGGQ